MHTENYMIQAETFRAGVSMQATLDHDFNVPDHKGDIERLLIPKADVSVQSVKVMRDKLMVKGILSWAVLYLKDRQNCLLEHMEGELPFEEVVNIDGISENADIKLDWEIEDLRVNMIHSRKFSLRSIINFRITADMTEEISVIKELSDENRDRNDNICIRQEGHDISHIAVKKKDTVRIQEEISLPGNKANMLEILWGEVGLRRVDVRLQDEKIILRGDSAIFLLYRGEKEDVPFEYMENDVPWHIEIPCTGVDEGMIADLHLHKIAHSLEMRPDQDGEMRNIAVEIVLKLDMDAYEDMQIHILSDAYSLDGRVKPVGREIECEHILIRNQSECKLYEKTGIPSEHNGVLQLCHPWAEVRLDRLEKLEEGIRAEGVVDVKILYVNVDDHLPLDIVSSMIPFSSMIETGRMPDDVRFEVQSYIDQLNVVMSSSDSADIKATIRLDTIVYEKRKINVVTELQETVPDEKYIESIPNMIGYVVKRGDDLFSIGKKFYTTREAIMAVNGMERGEIEEGEKLLIVKQMRV